MLFIAIALTAVWTAFPAVITLSAVTLGDNPDNVSLRLNTFTTDPSQSLGTGSISINQQAETAIGDSSGGAIEATSSNPTVRTVLVDSNYVYIFTFNETAGTCPDCWAGGERFKIQVIGFDSDLSDSIDLTSGGLFVKQDSATASLEGVTVYVDLGTRTNLFESFDIIVERI